MEAKLKRLVKAAAWVAAGGLFGAWSLWRRALSGRREVPRLREVRSILAIRLDLMGDLLFTLPAIQALHEAAPRARVSVLALPYTADLLRGLPFVDRVVAVDPHEWRRPGAWLRGATWRRVAAALGALRGERYDLCVSFYGKVGAAAAVLSGARYRVGYRAEGFPFSFDREVGGRRYGDRRHESEYCMDLARAAGADDAGPVRLALDPSAADRVEALLEGAGVGPGERLVALHPGALNMAAKRWMPERWAAVADRVQRESGRRVVLVGSASEMPLVARVMECMETPVVTLAGKTSLAELAALLRRCELFLGCDSGPLHLASALSVPSVSIYGPTDPGATGPLGPAARVLRGEVECSPCYAPAGTPSCRRGDVLCMESVSVEAVFRAIRQVMSDE